jgi:hypothetical protein
VRSLNVEDAPSLRAAIEKIAQLRAESPEN